MCLCNGTSSGLNTIEHFVLYLSWNFLQIRIQFWNNGEKYKFSRILNFVISLLDNVTSAKKWLLCVCLAVYWVLAECNSSPAPLRCMLEHRFYSIVSLEIISHHVKLMVSANWIVPANVFSPSLFDCGSAHSNTSNATVELMGAIQCNHVWIVRVLSVRLNGLQNIAWLHLTEWQICILSFELSAFIVANFG